MNINKSKVTLAAKIKSSGFEWPQFGKWATQDKDGEIFISGGDFTPVRMSGEVNWEFDAPYKSAGKVEVGLNWFQCILSREDYFHLYPALGELCGKVTEENRHESVWTNPPSIEQLAADYHAKQAIATQAQEEADSHRCGAEVALSKLEIAAKELGFKIEPITAKQEQEPTITDWRDLRVGDVIWVGGTIVTVDEPEGECEIIGENIYSYASGLRMFLQPFLVRRGDVEFLPDLKCRGWRFIRRP